MMSRKVDKIHKNIFRKVEAILNIFSREMEDIKEAKIGLLKMQIMSVMSNRLCTSEELISELEDMQKKLSKVKHTEKYWKIK